MCALCEFVRARTTVSCSRSDGGATALHYTTDGGYRTTNACHVSAGAIDRLCIGT